MAFSGRRKIASKDSVYEVMPSSLVKIIPIGIRELIYEYSFDASPQWFNKTPTLHTFFGISLLHKQILAIADDAGALEEIEFYIRKAHARGEPHLPVTFRQAIHQAIIGLDQNIFFRRDEKIAEGMAEKLLALYRELFPDTYAEALTQATLASPQESEKEKQSREQANVVAVMQIFDAIQKDDEHVNDAIETFNKFIRNTKPKIITTNKYYLNLIHLAYVTCIEYIRRSNMGSEEANGFWIAGTAIDKEFPPYLKRLLRSRLFWATEKIDRTDKIVDHVGYGVLGVTTLLRIRSSNRWNPEPPSQIEMAARFFEVCYEQVLQPHKFNLPQKHVNSLGHCLIM